MSNKIIKQNTTQHIALILNDKKKYNFATKKI